MRVKYVVQHFAYWSKTNGHSEWAHTITRTSDGKRVAFMCPDKSNARNGVCELVPDCYGYPAILDMNTVWLNNREFKGRTEDWPYAGGSTETIAKFLRKAFRTQKDRHV